MDPHIGDQQLRAAGRQRKERSHEPLQTRGCVVVQVRIQRPCHSRERQDRFAAGVTNRTVNYEVGALRGVLRQHGLWRALADKVKMLPEHHDVNQAITPEDESKMLAAASSSRSPAILPLVVFSLDTGMCLAEKQALRYKDVQLGGSIARGQVIVPKSKTPAGTGRMIPLSRRVCACLSLWIERFPDANRECFIFPFHKAVWQETLTSR